MADNATITRDIICGDNFNCVVRGDVHSIRLGNKVNVQDATIIHCTYQKFNVKIGNNVSITHRAITHGCHIHDNVLIGIGAIVMDGMVIESNLIVATGAVVLEGTHIKSEVYLHWNSC